MTAAAKPEPIYGVEKRWAECRRPIQADEVPRLLDLGQELAAMRRASGKTQAWLGVAAGISTTHVGHLERGLRRTRRSTLERIVRALEPHLPGHAASVDDLVDYLVGVAGRALAPESEHAARVARRRLRREAKAERLVEQVEPVARIVARQMLADLLEERDARRRRRQRPVGRSTGWWVA